MKKILLLLLAVVACFVGAKADELTVADGTETNVFLPIYGSYFDNVGTLGQVIYPAAYLADMACITTPMVAKCSSSIRPRCLLTLLDAKLPA